ncbi:uncharacterized protein KY384_004098 [Bacidia gigantensis]|uniref:uncharacterized protein n=1 Tax=Bacidia gigantensis TaxID=2732470 RepID=UPI001D046459|nr:uncharacterized protein KY384_004098 [Bacidia gigantensis]KAG8530741.1 hypothetical protein KY384_004098 [Bacidia gigantensis]
MQVARSILGTWRGERGEEWSSAQGLESILISIQSLMSPNPFENEPGFENANSKDDKKNQAHYVAKIRHETIRIAIIQRLEDYLGIHSDGTVDDFPVLEENVIRTEYDVEPAAPPYEPFNDLCKRRFLWYYDTYMATIAEGQKSIKPDQDFVQMPFEGGGNTMGGKFYYPELKRRMELIQAVLTREVEYWAREGALEVRKDTSVASMMGRQFHQIKESYKKNDVVTLDMELIDQNPFMWRLIFFGRPMTNLEGGMFKIKIAFSKRFPDELPRVIFETKIYHHRVTKDGILCYIPKRQDDVKSHIDAVVEAIEDADTPYDPRTLVHPEASKLYWGSADEKKLYNRQLRRSVQRSME